MNASEEAYRFTIIIFCVPGNPVLTPAIEGAKEAAKKLGCSVDLQFAHNDAVRQNNIIETAITNKVDGVGLIINLNDAYNDSISRALSKGIPVIAFNIDDSRGAKGCPRLAFIGQDMRTAGYIIAKKLIKDAGLTGGDFVVCPAEIPESVYAVQRYEGAKRAFDEAYIRSEVLRSGDLSLEDNLNKITQYLLGHKDTDAVLGLGGMPTEMAPQAIEEVGMNIPNAGFDITRMIAENIKDGRTLATIDQQPFLQTFLTVTQLYLTRKYGLSPCDVNTGGGVIDRTNVQQVLEYAGTSR